MLVFKEQGSFCLLLASVWQESRTHILRGVRFFGRCHKSLPEGDALVILSTWTVLIYLTVQNVTPAIAPSGIFPSPSHLKMTNSCCPEEDMVWRLRGIQGKEKCVCSDRKVTTWTFSVNHLWWQAADNHSCDWDKSIGLRGFFGWGRGWLICFCILFFGKVGLALGHENYASLFPWKSDNIAQGLSKNSQVFSGRMTNKKEERKGEDKVCVSLGTPGTALSPAWNLRLLGRHSLHLESHLIVMTSSTSSWVLNQTSMCSNVMKHPILDVNETGPILSIRKLKWMKQLFFHY